MVGRRLASGGRIDRSRPHLGPEGSGEPTYPGDSPTAAFVASGRMIARTSDSGRPRGVVRDGQIPGPTLGADGADRTDEARTTVAPRPECDLLVVGAGPAGLSAALTGARTGLSVTLVDRAPGPGGAMLSDAEIGWAQDIVTELVGLGAELVFSAEVEQLSPAGSGEDAQRGGFEVSVRCAPGTPCLVTAGRVVLATGAVERPVLFPGNGTPGVMPAETVRALLLRYGVLAGEQVVLLAADDDAYRVAGDLLAVGASVAVIDPRPDPEGGPDATFAGNATEPLPTGVVLHRAAVSGVQTDDAGVLTGVSLRAADGTRRTAPADLLAVSGGWNPALALFTGSGGEVVFDPDRGAYLPQADLHHLHVVGAARGLRTNAECVADGAGAGGLKGLSGELVMLPPPVDLDPARQAPVAFPPAVDLASTDGDDILLDLAGDRTVADLLRDLSLTARPGGPDGTTDDVLARLLAAPAAGLFPG